MGRVIPSPTCRVFSDEPKDFYKVCPITTNYPAQHLSALATGLVSEKIGISEIEKSLVDIKTKVKDSSEYKNIFEATAIPFCLTIPNVNEDIGTKLEAQWLPLLKKEYEKRMSGAYFKPNFQGQKNLIGSLKVSKNSGYNIFLELFMNSSVVGYYFPTAFQEFDIDSQRLRIKEFPNLPNVKICLSGPFEIIYSLISYPMLLYNKLSYSPILCASALEHVDPRMVLMFKSYGPHLEFWLMSQMLTPTKTQVSEQWSGGITIFKPL